MKNWMKFLETLAGKLTAILAFAILLIVLIALIGARIEDRFLPLVYIAALGAMAIFTYQIFVRYKSSGAHGEKNANAPAPVQNANPTNSKPADARERYLRAVIADCRTLRLVGIDPQASDPTRGGLTLESLYISLDTTTPVDKKTEKIKSKEPVSEDEAQEALRQLRGDEMRPLGALEALSTDADRHVVLLGLPGTGKSTFVRYLALRMAQAEVDRSKNIQTLLPNWQGGPVLPIIVSLGRLAETIPADCKQGSAKLVEDYIVQSLKSDERMAGFADQILDELEKRGGLVLFDGLDEVANLNLRPIIVQSVEDFVEHYKRQQVNRFLVTCRTYSYHNDSHWQLTGWSTHELALLDEKKIKDFVVAWHNEHAKIEPARKADYEKKGERLLASLQPDDRRRLHEIAPFPIILTMMAVVHTHYGDLPNSRAEVYERCVDLLLVRWELERPVSGQPQHTQKRTIIDELGIDPTVLNRALWEIAFKAHEGRQTDDEKKRGPALVTEDLLTSVLWKHFPDPKQEKVHIFLDYCQSSNGLLMLQGSVAVPDAPADTPPLRVYAFPHLTFEEFLAARYLLDRSNFGKLTRELVQKDDRWREVVILLGEVINFARNDSERMETLLSALAPEKVPAKIDHPDWRAVWYAGDLLALYQRNHFQEKASAEQKIRKGLFSLVTKGALSPRERAAAADTLDELGYVPNDLHALLLIANEKYYLSKYLVTNLQYERFLKPENFANQEYWMDFPKYDENSQRMDEKTFGREAWDWLQRALKEEDNLVEHGVLYPRYWRDPRFGSAHHTAPVVGISWYEASAYCKWLFANWEELEEGKQGFASPSDIRLPLETEWETAAGGINLKGRFAWGVLKDEEEITRFANTYESGINKTTPVWMYPQGASPHKLMDMSGNVWEWQANYRDVKNDWLGLRGGSWSDDGARRACRVPLRLPPVLQGLNFIGFRVCVLPK